MTTTDQNNYVPSTSSLCAGRNIVTILEGGGANEGAGYKLEGRLMLPPGVVYSFRLSRVEEYNTSTKKKIN